MPSEKPASAKYPVEFNADLVDAVVGVDTRVTPANINNVVPKAVWSLVELKRTHEACAGVAGGLRAENERLGGVIKTLHRTVADRDTTIRELKEERAEIERADALDARVSGSELFGILARLRGGVGLAVVVLGVAVVGVLASTLYDSGGSRAVVPEALGPAELEQARATTVPGLGSVKALQYRYSKKYGSYLVDLEVVPDSSAGVNFVAVSPAYSSLTVDGAILSADPRARVGGAYDIDGVIEAWGRSKGSVSQLRRQIDRTPGCQVAPGRPRRVTLAFRPPEGQEIEKGDWAKVSLLFWTSETLDSLDPTARFGEALVDAAYAADGQSVRALDEPVRVALAAPFLADWKPSEEGADARATRSAADPSHVGGQVASLR